MIDWRMDFWVPADADHPFDVPDNALTLTAESGKEHRLVVDGGSVTDAAVDDLVPCGELVYRVVVRYHNAATPRVLLVPEGAQITESWFRGEWLRTIRNERGDDGGS